MNQFIKNLEFAQVFKFADQVSYLPGQIVSKTLAQNESVSLTLFAFDEGEEISTHESSGDALVLVLDGQGQIIIDGEKFDLKTGDSILMPAGHPHAVYGLKRFKMFLIVVFPPKNKGE